MGQYSIKDLEHLSGIKAHTIRIWEQRYGLLEPKRTDTNIRYYDDEQMRRLLNITTLMAMGIKISKIAELSQDEISDKIDSKIAEDEPNEPQVVALINQIIKAGLSFDEVLFEKAFSSALLRYEIKEAYLKVIYPVLMKVGMMWSNEEIIPAQEHFISYLIKRKLFSALDMMPAPEKAKDTWVLFLPEAEDHEIGLLLSALLLKKSGHKVVYLGRSVPYANIKSVIDEVGPKYLHYFVVRKQPPPYIQEYIDRITGDFEDVNVWIAGSKSLGDKINIPANARWISELDEFLKIP